MMNICKRALSLLLVLAFFSTSCISAMAAVYDAATAEQMQTAFGDSSGEDVNINLTADIDMSGKNLTAKEGITYRISTQNDSTLNQASFDGAGTVHVETDITGNAGDALTTSGSVTVNVTGTLNAEGSGVSADGSSTVTVTGNIVAGGDGVYAADDSTVTVNGELTTADSGVDVEGHTNVTINGSITSKENGVIARSKDNVTVTGNIDAAYNGVYGLFDSNVTVTGNVNAGMTGVYTKYDSTVTVTGDITAVDCGVDAEDDSMVHVNGNVSGGDGDPEKVDFADPQDFSDGSDGVSARDYATVTVSGNVTGGDAYGTSGEAGSAVSASDASSITVGGDAIGGSVIANPDTTGGVSYGGNGVTMDNVATVSIGGNAIGGSTNGDQGVNGNGACIRFYTYGYLAGSLTVGGAVQGAGDGSDLFLEGGYDEDDFEMVLIPSIQVGALETVDSKDISPEDLEKLLSQLQVTGGEATWDDFWTNVLERIRIAQEGSQLTVDAGNYTRIPAYVLEAAAQRNVTLIIRWNGGDTITVDKAVELSADSMLLSELLK